LNTDWPSRASGVLVIAAVAAALATVYPAWATSGLMTALACVAGVVALNAGFYRLCMRRYGAVFAVAAVGLHLLFFCYTTLAFGGVALASCIPGGARPGDATAARRRLPGSRPPRRPAGIGTAAESWTASPR
ncbi:MAG: hypothetical protein ACKO5R_09155, partial [Planctomycetaceae bacterium]